MSDTTFNLNKSYDVIIVGAGPAGCVLASRLSEHADKNVLLIEAGPDAAPGAEHPDIRDPFPLSSGNRAFHWPGLTADMEADVGGDTACVARPYIKGYGVGGGSNVNGMGADRGQPDEYDEWRDQGAENWGWDNVLPYFKKMERYLDFTGPNAMQVHGDSGPMPVRRLSRSRWAPFTAAIGDALQRRGFDFIEDYMTDFREGFSGVPTNSLLQGRVSASMAYLTRKVRRRPNLTILANALVDRVSIEDRRASGVFVHMNGTSALVSGRQIIVSCGAIQSPAVLMRSGIGPAEHLARHGIAVIQELRGVGANLHNHPCVNWATYLPRGAFQAADNPWFLQNWLRFSSNYPGCSRNDMHLLQINKTSWHALGQRVGMVAISVLESHSAGRVELSSVDPAIAPKVCFNLLADPRDYERLVAGMRFTLELLMEPGVAAMRRQMFLPNGRIVDSLRPHTAWNAFKARALGWALDWAPLRHVLLASSRIDPQLLLADDKVLRGFVRRHVHPQIHDSGTCRMGRADDADAVVDGAGRVHGIEALRVVDTSIFPTVPRGYPHFIVIMTAEKIADAIKADCGKAKRAWNDNEQFNDERQTRVFPGAVAEAAQPRSFCS